MAARQKAVATLPNLIRTLKNDRRKPGFSQPLPSLRRAFSLYDQINLIDNVPEDQLRFQRYCPNFSFLSFASISFLNFISLTLLCGDLRYTETGFTVNGVDYEGSLLCVGNLLMSWTPKKFSEITSDSLSIFQIVRPIPEILILGCGRYTEPVNPELRQFIRSTGMKLEAVDTRNAASTYNILNEEGRIVAAALLPYGVSS
ncbi:hypothetical protein Csa_005003 [Cucumis sativus]|nr:hypothetical protein Csa_005003 [Cucumis sativus]